MLNSFLNLFLATPCGLCERSAVQWGLCQDCFQQLEDCRWGDERFIQHAKSSPSTAAVISWGHYGGTLKRAIAALKYKNQTQLAEPLGLRLAEAWLATAPTVRPVTLPIPLHSAKRKQRGFNQADLLAKFFCRRLGLPLNQKFLQRTRPTQPQFSLSPNERRQNLMGAFFCEPRHRPNRPVLLLDDIYTTGATVAAAQIVLEAAGISVLGTITVAQATKGGGQGKWNGSPVSQTQGLGQDL